jgi:transcription termination factor NusB
MAKVDIQSKKKDSHFEQEVDEITNRLMEKGNPEEYAKQEVRLAWKEASKVFRDLVESLPNQKKELEAHAGDFLKLMSKQYLDAFNRALAIRIHGMREKLMDKSMKHEILVIAVTNGYCQLGQFQSRIGNLFMRLLTDIEKIAGIG